ncbi:hypothetical protein Bca52824_048828 [Brassica carinata]|uniref:Uncharacterized protein n=1 Tax=Brassica carinata TaxID=52824 RepID=A0A8X7RPB5_BRACI|nr:hypothetical protein Bca52824_048828 [Brassica carinata]
MQVDNNYNLSIYRSPAAASILSSSSTVVKLLNDGYGGVYPPSFSAFGEYQQKRADSQLRDGRRNRKAT